MPTYIVLGNFTDQGIRAVKDSPKRLEAVKAMCQQAGVTLKETYYTLGQYDLVAVFEAPDDAAITALGLDMVIDPVSRCDPCAEAQLTRIRNGHSEVAYKAGLLFVTRAKRCCSEAMLFRLAVVAPNHCPCRKH